jgi:rod shape-determining protein MreD
MRWVPFLFLLYFAAALRAAGFLGFPASATPLPSPCIEYVVLLVVFYAFYADEHHAALAGLAAGFATDLISPFDVLGTSTVAMGLVAVGIVKIRLSIFREQAASKIIMTLLAVLAYAVIAAVLRTLGTDLLGVSFQRYLWLMCGNAMYTGLVAPAAFWLLIRLRPLLGVGAHGPRMR